MAQYFFKLTEEEKDNILNKHKHVYNGYSVSQISSNTQPLYVQDFANDKGGLTVNNKGEVTEYRNVGINESFVSLGKKDDNKEQYEKVNYLDVNEDLFGFLKKKKKGSDKKPYTAEAVKKIIDYIKDAKNEDQLESAMQMARNLYDSNDDVNDAYRERIFFAYRRKADELGNYLTKKDMENIFSDVDNDVDFKDDSEKIKESLVDTYKWFKKIK